jgi:hypothetical protein
VVTSFTNGGSIAIVDVYKWQSGALQKQNIGGQTCGTQPNQHACAITNINEINAPSNWNFPTSTIPAQGFVEGAIELSFFYPSSAIPCFR